MELELKRRCRCGESNRVLALDGVSELEERVRAHNRKVCALTIGEDVNLVLLDMTCNVGMPIVCNEVKRNRVLDTEVTKQLVPNCFDVGAQELEI